MFGSIAPFAQQRNETRMKTNLTESGLFPDAGPTSTARMHRQLQLIQRGGEFDIARMRRMAQEDRLTARLDEERQIAELTTARHPGLNGEHGRVRAAQQAANLVFAANY